MSSLDAIAAIVPLLSEDRVEICRTGALTARVQDAVRESGALAMSVPLEHGGSGVDPITWIASIDLLASGCGAVAWNVATHAAASTTAGYLTEVGQREIFAHQGRTWLAGSLPPQGTARLVDGGCHFSGRWRFGSGCQDADWILGGAVLTDSDGNPVRDEAGAVQTRTGVFARDEIQIRENWDVIGLRGTGSHDWEFDGVVPLERVIAESLGAGTLWPTGERLPIAVVGTHFSAVATGLADAAVQAGHSLGDKTPAGSPKPLRGRLDFQEKLGRAAVALEAARAVRTDALTDAWHEARTGAPVSTATRARSRSASAYATEVAVHIIDSLYAIGGTTTITLEHPIAQAHLDVHVVAQNLNVQPTWYAVAGRHRLGEPVERELF